MIKMKYFAVIGIFILLSLSFYVLAQTPYTLTAKNQAGQTVSNVTQGETYTIIATGQITGQGVSFSLYTRDSQNEIVTQEAKSATPPGSCTETECTVSYTVPTTSGIVSFTAQVEDSATTWTVISTQQSPSPSPNQTTSPSPSPSTSTSPTTTSPAPTQSSSPTPLPTQSPITIAGCQDSDAGYSSNDIYTIGTTKKGSESKTDRCNGSKVEEYYCDSVGIKSKQVDCPLGCLNGVCVVPENYCIGSRESTPFVSNSITFFSSLLGVTNDSNTVYTNTQSTKGVQYGDSCSDSEGNLNEEGTGTHVTEYVCSQNLVDKVITACSWGCVNGACNVISGSFGCSESENGVVISNQLETVEIKNICTGKNLGSGRTDTIVRRSCSAGVLAVLPTAVGSVALESKTGSIEHVIKSNVEKCTCSDGKCLEKKEGPKFFEIGEPGDNQLLTGKQVVTILFNLPIRL